MDLGLFVDIFVGLVVLVSVGIAFVRGFIREVLTVFGIVGGIIAAYIGGPLLSPIIRGWLGVEEGAETHEALFGLVPYPMLADILAYGLILILFVIILSIISHYIAEFARNLGLGALDRSLGVVFGIARAVLVLGLLYLPFHVAVSDEQKEEWFDGSHSSVYLEATAEWMSAYLPKNVEEKMEEGVKQAGDMSEMRKKVQELGVLGEPEKKAEERKDTVGGDEKAPKSEDGKDGYTDEFRNKMNELFEDKIDNTPSNTNE